MTKDEAETLLYNAWAAYKGGQSFSEYKKACKEVYRAGFRIRRGYVSGKFCFVVARKVRGLAAKWRELNLNPNGQDVGDCTSRALAYCFPEVGYMALNSKQRQKAKEFGMTWKTSLVWKRVATDQGGYKFFKLAHPLSRAKVAAMTAHLQQPTLSISSRHVAVCDKGEVIDSWDSRCGRVKELGVGPKDFEAVKKISELHLRK